MTSERISSGSPVIKVRSPGIDSQSSPSNAYMMERLFHMKVDGSPTILQQHASPSQMSPSSSRSSTGPSPGASPGPSPSYMPLVNRGKFAMQHTKLPSITARDPGPPVKSEHAVSSTGIMCAVCGDAATGRYFGAHICEACKSFFIRSTKKGEPKFRCVSDQNCQINKYSRLLCQYCRYQNCMKAGMGRKAKPTSKDLTQDQVPCKVCGDVSSGIHFGVYTCEGCKGFFRRSLRDGSTYTCAGKEECNITPMTRNLCRYCRFTKCLATGMSRACIKLGRHQKYDIKHQESGEHNNESLEEGKQPAVSPGSSEGSRASPSISPIVQIRSPVVSVEKDRLSQERERNVLEKDQNYVQTVKKETSVNYPLKKENVNVNLRSALLERIILPTPPPNVPKRIPQKPVRMWIESLPSSEFESPVKRQKLAVSPAPLAMRSPSPSSLLSSPGKHLAGMASKHSMSHNEPPPAASARIIQASVNVDHLGSPESMDTAESLTQLHSPGDSYFCPSPNMPFPNISGSSFVKTEYQKLPHQCQHKFSPVDLTQSSNSNPSRSGPSFHEVLNQIHFVPDKNMSGELQGEIPAFEQHIRNKETVAQEVEDEVQNNRMETLSPGEAFNQESIGSEEKDQCSMSTSSSPASSHLMSPSMYQALGMSFSPSSCSGRNRLTSSLEDIPGTSTDCSKDYSHAGEFDAAVVRANNTPEVTLMYDRLFTCPLAFSLPANFTRSLAMVCHELLQRYKGGHLRDHIFDQQTEQALYQQVISKDTLEMDSMLFEVTRAMQGYSAVMKGMAEDRAVNESAEHLAFHRDCASGEQWDKFLEAINLKIVACVQYIKKVPGLNMIRIEDQVQLIKSSAFPLILIHKCWKMGHEFNWFEKTFLTNNHLRCMGDGFKYPIYAFANQFALFSYDSIELALLMILVVLNPELETLVDRPAVLQLHKEYRAILKKYCQETHGSLSHYYLLMQFIPMLSNVDRVHKYHIRKNHKPGLEMPALFTEVNLNP